MMLVCAGGQRHGRVRWLGWAALGGLLLVVGTTVTVYFWGRHHWEQAQQSLARHHLTEAREHLRQCRRLWPRDEEALLLDAQVARRLDDYPAAQRLQEEYAQRHGWTEALVLESVLLQAQQGDLTHANRERDLQALINREHPASLLIVEALAKGYMSSYRAEEARYSLDFLLEREPNHLPALALRGRLSEGQKQDEQARADYERALDLNPDVPGVRCRLADCLARLGHVREAVAHYEYLRARPPVAPEVVLGLAHCRQNLHELDEARALLEGLLQEDPTNTAAVAEWGRVLLRQGRASEAEARLRDAIARDPHHPDARLVLSLCLDAQGKKAEAEQVLARLREIDDNLMRLTLLKDQLSEGIGDEFAMRHEIGVLSLRIGEEAQGVRWLLSVLDRRPTHAPTHQALAEYYDRIGNRAAAENHRRAAQATPDPR